MTSSQFYNAVSDTYASLLTGTEAETPLDLAMIDHALSLVCDGARILDAGCGTGRLFPLLMSNGAMVEGIDISEGMVRKAREAYSSVPIAVGDLTALPHTDGTFDAVVSWYSTIHLSDDQLALGVAEMRRVLRPGGYALLAFQTGDAPRTVGEGFASFGHEVAIVRWHRRVPAMISVLEHASFDIVTSLQRAAHGSEPDGQGFVLARAI